MISVKKRNDSSQRFLKLFLVLALVISSFIPFVSNVEAEGSGSYQATNISFAPGADETKYNFSWYSPETSNPGVVEYAKKSDMTGEVFPSELAKTTTATVANASSGYSTHKATITDVESASEYVYRIGDGNGKWSDTYSFKTHDTDSYNFLIMGDTQIGSGKVPSDTEGWVNTLNKAYAKYPDSSFILSVGDQVNNANSEEEYAGYFTPKELKQVPTATTIGNHDNSNSYKQHFNVPNETTYGATAAGGDYSFTRGDTLFMVLNSNNKNASEHNAFMEETVAANPDAKWKFVVLHHSIYSAASHSLETSIVKLREELVPTIDQLDIDAVLMGHDHSYVRTYQMEGLQPLKNQMIDEQGRVINPTGTMYLTVNSSSGSKYYNLKETPEPYSAVRSQLKTPTFSNVTVTPTSVEFSTYRVDTMEQVDTYTIVKDPSIPVKLPELKKVHLEASGEQVPTNPSSFFEDVKLTLTGENKSGGPFDVPYSDISYKVKEEGQISISPSGEITVLEGAKPGKIQVWAEVQSNGKKFKTKKMHLTIVEHAEETIVEKGSNWKYLDDGSDQGTAWKAPEFDDSSWKSGLAPLGYPISEDRPMFGDIQTLIGYGPDSANKYPTTYFRTTFELEDLSKIGEMARINFGIDDSVILYLNGQEIGRHNLPEGDISYDKYLSDLAGSSVADESAYESFDLTKEDLAHLVQGTNVLAAEIHQDRPTSSDVYWDMEFVTTVKSDAGEKKNKGKDKK
ncbi:Calcineurin-like phosphoesterase [Psychrobacillus sp. OK032]|nr:Calcineurin-like phosphoesterase [Psychrobacillus sp. OK032]